jgi:Caspase domain
MRFKIEPRNWRPAPKHLQHFCWAVFAGVLLAACSGSSGGPLSGTQEYISSSVSDETSVSAQTMAQYRKINELRSAYRVALVVGNANYQALPELRTPKNDASAVASMLQKSGFNLVGGAAQINVTVQKFHELTAALNKAVATHRDALVFVYFSGHGFIAGGRNALAAVNTRPSNADAATSSISVKEIAEGAVNSGAGMVMMLLDACRENSSGALVDEPVPMKSFIGFAAVFGSPALELKDEPNSAYTEAILKEFPSNWMFPEDLHAAIASDVGNRTKAGQIPVYREGEGAQLMPVGLVFNPTGSDNKHQVLHGELQMRTELAAQCRDSSSDGAIWFKMITQPGWLGAQQNEDGGNEELKPILDSCRAAYEAGARDRGTLGRLSLAVSVARSRKMTIPDGKELEQVSGYFLIQAAEEGDPWSDAFLGVFQARQATIRNSSEEMSVAHERLLRAARSDVPYLTMLVAMMLLAPASDPNMQMLPHDAVSGSALLIQSAKKHVVLATELLAMKAGVSAIGRNALAPQDQKNSGFLQDILVPDGLDMRNVIQQTILDPKEGDISASSLAFLGFSGLDSLIALSVYDGFLGLFGEPNPNVYVAAMLKLEPALRNAQPKDIEGLADLVDNAGCILSGGIKFSGPIDSFHTDLGAAGRFFEIAKRLGSDRAAQHLNYLNSSRISPCWFDFDSTIARWKAKRGIGQSQ